MNNQTLFLIIIVIVLIFLLPDTCDKNYVKSNSQQVPLQQVSLQQVPLQQVPSQQVPSFWAQFFKFDFENLLNPQKYINPTNMESQNLIDEYLHETDCEEDFETGYKEGFATMGQGMNMGNDMLFTQTISNNPSQLDKSLSNSLVPDFEPNRLNINPDLNSYGYAITDSNDYFVQRGFMNPTTSKNYADDVQYNLEHSNQIRYCK